MSALDPCTPLGHQQTGVGTVNCAHDAWPLSSVIVWCGITAAAVILLAVLLILELRGRRERRRGYPASQIEHPERDDWLQ